MKSEESKEAATTDLMGLFHFWSHTLVRCSNNNQNASNLVHIRIDNSIMCSNLLLLFLQYMQLIINVYLKCENTSWVSLWWWLLWALIPCCIFIVSINQRQCQNCRGQRATIFSSLSAHAKSDISIRSCHQSRAWSCNLNPLKPLLLLFHRHHGPVDYLCGPFHIVLLIAC